MKPCVSIVIPSYNSAAWIGDAIRSCIAQTLVPLHIIVVNDGSTDVTDEAVRPFMDRILYIRQSNGGVAVARNVGARLAAGNWLLFLDADDILRPRALERLVDVAMKGDAGVVFGRVHEQRGDVLLDRTNRDIAGLPPHPTKCNFWKSLIVTPGAAIVQRDLYETVGGFNGILPPSEDRNFWLKCGMLKPFVFCDEVILDKRSQPASASMDRDRMIFQGMLSQLDFLGWAKSRGMDLSFLNIDRAQVAMAAIEAADKEGCHTARQAIFLYAHMNRLTTLDYRQKLKVGCLYHQLRKVLDFFCKPCKKGY